MSYAVFVPPSHPAINGLIVLRPANQSVPDFGTYPLMETFEPWDIPANNTHHRGHFR